MLNLVRYISRLIQLDDVRSAPAPEDGQVLTYRTADSKWGPEDAGGGGGVTALDTVAFDAGTDTVALPSPEAAGLYVQPVECLSTGAGEEWGLEIAAPATTGIQVTFTVFVVIDGDEPIFNLGTAAGAFMFSPHDTGALSINEQASFISTQATANAQYTATIVSVPVSEAVRAAAGVAAEAALTWAVLDATSG